MEGDLNYGPGETQKTVPVQLLELGEKDGLLEDKPVKQFVMDLSNPRQGAKLGRYPRTTVTITDHPGEWTQAAVHQCVLLLLPVKPLIAKFFSLDPYHFNVFRAQCDDVQKGHPELQHTRPNL